MELSRNPLSHRIVRLAREKAHGRLDEASPTAPPSPFDKAIEHFAHGRWMAAFDELVPLADTGHPEAARIVVLMAMRGPRLFGQTFPASPSQRERWQAAANAVCVIESRE